jgi:hypothetical protein
LFSVGIGNEPSAASVLARDARLAECAVKNGSRQDYGRSDLFLR